MSLNNVDSSSGALVATGYDGDAVSTAIIQDVADGDFISIRNIQSKEEYANISEAIIADTLVTSSLIVDGDNLVIVKDDNTIHEVVASGITGVGPYSMDTTAITAGEIPSKVFTVDSKVSFDDGAGFVYPSELGNNYLAVNNAAPVPDLTPGLVAHYLLNNNADDSHGIYDGTPSGGVDFQGDVAKFEGVDGDINTSYSLVDTNTVDKPFTLSIWYKRNGNISQGTGSTGDKHPIATSGQDGALVDFNFDFSANMDTDTISAQLVSGSFEHRILCLNTPSGQDLSVGYHHYVISYDGSKLASGIKVYCDGVELTTTATSQGTYVGMNIEPLLIGSALKNDSVSYRYANGMSSNFRLYNEAKSQEFITALYEEGYYPKPLPLPTTTGLIAHYPLTGTAEDTTSNYDGTEVGGLTYVDDAERGSVAYFDGVSKYINVPSLPTALTSFPITFSSYMYIDVTLTGTAHCGVTLSNSADDDAYLITSYGATSKEIVQYINNGGHITLNAYTVTTSGWYHVLCTFSSGSSKMYINGVLHNENTTAITIPITNSFDIGKLNRPTAGYYEGDVSNVRVYNVIPTATEITDIYNYEKNFRPIDIDDGLVAYYPLANNSLDNYYNEFDGVDTDMTYDGLSGVFNGATSKISNLSFPQYSTLTACSLSMWVSCDMSITSNFVNIDNNSGLRIRSTNGNIQVLNNGAGSNFMANRIVATNEMVHIVVVNDATGLYLYLDAILDNSNSIPLQSSSSSMLGLFLGHYIDNSVSTELLDGTLAKVRIYNKAITAEQVEAIYNTEKGEVPIVSSLTNTRQYDDIVIDGRSIETKVEIKSIGDKCTEVSADLWKIS